MHKAELQQQLLIHHKEFINALLSMDASLFDQSKNNKWTPAQHLDHMVRSTGPVLLALRLPLVVTRLLFGKANRSSKSYQALVDKYLDRLQAGGKASGRFIPSQVTIKDRAGLCKRLENTVVALTKSLDKFSEEELDKHILPHPLLGKLTYREMIYFTIYHVQHHQKLLP